MANRIVHIYTILLFLLILVPFTARAQWNFDVLTVEALIKDHKNIRSVLLARSALEQANEVLHNYSMEASVGYDSLNVKLDKYTKCFDIIDIIYNSGMTVLNVYNLDYASIPYTLHSPLVQPIELYMYVLSNP